MFFDVGWSELLVILILAIVFIGPEQMPVLAYKIGQWVGLLRQTGAQWHHHIEQMGHHIQAREHNRHILTQEAEEAKDNK